MAEQVRVKIRGIVVTSRYGTLTTGQILITDAEYARHLVEQCHAGDYMDTAKSDDHQIQNKQAKPVKRTKRNGD